MHPSLLRLLEEELSFKAKLGVFSHRLPVAEPAEEGTDNEYSVLLRTPATRPIQYGTQQGWSDRRLSRLCHRGMYEGCDCGCG